MKIFPLFEYSFKNPINSLREWGLKKILVIPPILNQLNLLISKSKTEYHKLTLWIQEYS